MARNYPLSAYAALDTVLRTAQVTRFLNPHISAAGAAGIGTITSFGNTQPTGMTHEIQWKTHPEVFKVNGCANPIGTGSDFVQFPTVTEFSSGAGNVSSNPPRSNCSWRVEFNLWGDKCSVFMGDNGNPYRFLVDEYDGKGLRYINKTQLNSPNAGYFQYVLLDFSAGLGVRHRKICVEGQQAGSFSGAGCAPTHVISATSGADITKCIMIGDSIMDGIGASFKGNAFARVMGDALGMRNLIHSGLGGAGYLNTVSGTKYTIRQRLLLDVTSQRPDIAIFHTGRNDISFTAPSTQNEVAATIAAFRAQPETTSTPLFVFGSHQGQDTAINTLVLGVENEIKTATLAAKAAGDKLIAFVPVTSRFDPLIRGTGRVGATTGNGNADTWVSSDGVHYSDTGHINSGLATADDLLTAINTMIKGL